MRTVKALLAISLIAGAASVHAATYHVMGSLAAWSSSTPDEVTTYPGGAPLFSGTIDSISGAYSFIFQPSITAHISVFDGYYTADETFAGQRFSGTGTGVVTRTTDSISCMGSPIICGNLPFATINGTLSSAFTSDHFYYYGTLNTTQGTFNGPATATYFFYAPLYDPLSCYEGVDCPPPPTYAAPVPAAAWLFGSGLIGLTAAARRRIAKNS